MFKCSTCYDLRNGLSGYYKFESSLSESLLDMSGNGRTLTTVNSPTFSSSVGLNNTGGM